MYTVYMGGGGEDSQGIYCIYVHGVYGRGDNHTSNEMYTHTVHMYVHTIRKCVNSVQCLQCVEI